jgi:hypothetical protein
MALQDKYGSGQDILSTLTGHLGAMAREGALVDVLGPQHAATAQMLAKNAGPGKRPASPASASSGRRACSAWKAPARSTAPMRAERPRQRRRQCACGAAARLGALADGGVVAGLGGDPGDDRRQRHGAAGGALQRHGRRQGAGARLETIFAENPKMQEDAARLLVTGHAMSDHAISTLRYADQLFTPELIKKTSDFVIRASGLTAWTEGIKKAFTMEMLGFHRPQSDSALAISMRRSAGFLKRYGISPPNGMLRALPPSIFAGRNSSTARRRRRPTTRAQAL